MVPQRRLYKKRSPPGARGQFMSRPEAARRPSQRRPPPRRGPDARQQGATTAATSAAKTTSPTAMMHRRRTSAAVVAVALGILGGHSLFLLMMILTQLTIKMSTILWRGTNANLKFSSQQHQMNFTQAIASNIPISEANPESQASTVDLYYASMSSMSSMYPIQP